MIRVLQISDRMNRGGQETLLMNLYENIDRTQVQFDFIEFSTERCAYDDEIESLGGRIYRLPNKRAKFYKCLKGISRIVQEGGYQIIHRNYSQSTMALDLLAARLGGAKHLIAHSHSNLSSHTIIHKLFQPLLNAVSTERFACSQEAGDWMYGNKDFTIINNGIKVERYSFNPAVRETVRRELNIGNSFVVGHVGRMHAPKNHSFLLEVFAQTHKLAPDAKLVLVGDGELKGEIVQKVDRLGLRDAVYILGARADISRLLQAMDVFVFPSIFEGFGIAPLEAEAAGLPCVMSDNVTEKLLLADNTVRLSLKAGAAKWAQVILTMRGKPRADIADAIRASGYDINHVARQLQDKYLKMAITESEKKQ